jgi:hypothetical protein
LSIAYLTWVIAVTPGIGHRPVDVVAGERPAHEHAAAEVVDSKGSLHGGFGLSRVGSNDLQVRPGSEREQRVMRTESDVPATGPRTDPEAVFQVGDCRGELGDSVDDVVNQHVNLASATYSLPQIPVVSTMMAGRPGTQYTAGWVASSTNAGFPAPIR